MGKGGCSFGSFFSYAILVGSNHEPLTLNRTFSVLSVISVCQFVKVNVNVKVEIMNH